MVCDLRQLKENLAAAKKDLLSEDEFSPLKLLGIIQDVEGVQSYTLYVRDPITDEFRLETHWGVKHIEPLVGFVLSLDQESRIRELNQNQGYRRKQYFENPNDAKLVGPAGLYSAADKRLNELAQEHREIYGTFAERESIKAVLRYESTVESRPQMVLFVNMCEFIEEHCEEIGVVDDIFAELENHIDVIRNALEHEFPKALRQLTCLLRPIHQLALRREEKTHREICDDFIKELLAAIVSSLDVSKQDGFASIHLFEPDQEGGVLRLAACTARSDGLPGFYKMFRKQSVVAWVAMKRHPLLINDMQTSVFNRIRQTHQDYDGTMSELAVPMLAGDLLIGVINIETKKTGAFTRQDLYALWIAATEAAAAYRVLQSLTVAEEMAANAKLLAAESQEIKFQTDRLLQIAHNAAQNADDYAYLNEIACILKEWSDAERAEIWVYDSIERAFSHAGASYAEFERHMPPRSDGWTNFVFRNQKMIWIDVCNYGEQNFRAQHWDEDLAGWSEKFSMDCPLPNALHSVVISEGVRCELAVPIVKQGKSIGVIWLKHDSEQKSPPAVESAKRLMMLTGQVALMIDLLELAEKREEREVREAIVSEHFPIGPISGSAMDGFLLYVPCEARLGGDFCSRVQTTSTSWSYLLGDVAGHGYRAALKMLPLITAFKIYQKECGSPDYALGQLINRFSEKSQFGTGIAFSYFEKLNAPESRLNCRRYVSAASAGHDPLILIRGNSMVSAEALPDTEGPGHTSGFGFELNEHFASQTTEVFSGDVLIAYTDGVSEVFREDVKFGRDRICAAAITARCQGPEQIAQAIFGAAQEWGRGVIIDDVTIFVAKIK